MPSTSNPFSNFGIACSWIGLGSVKPAALVAFRSWPEIPSLAKPFSSAAISLVKTIFFHADIAANSDGGRAQPAVKNRNGTTRRAGFKPARLRCRARQPLAAGLTPPCPKARGTDATSLDQGESRESPGPSAYEAAYGGVRSKKQGSDVALQHCASASPSGTRRAGMAAGLVVTGRRYFAVEATKCRFAS